MKIQKLNEYTEDNISSNITNLLESESDKITKTITATLECDDVSHEVSSDVDDYDSFQDFEDNEGSTYTHSEFTIKMNIGDTEKELDIKLDWEFYDNYGDLRISNVDVSVDGDDMFPFTGEEIAELCYKQYETGTWNSDALEAWNNPDEMLSPEALFDSVEFEKLKDYISDEYDNEFR